MELYCVLHQFDACVCVYRQLDVRQRNTQ